MEGRPGGSLTKDPFVLAADKLNYDHMRSALAVQEASRPSISLSEAGASDNVEDKLKEINIDALHYQGQGFEEFRQKIESLKNLKPAEEPSASGWKTELVKKRVDLKKKSDAVIDQSFDVAMAYRSRQWPLPMSLALAPIIFVRDKA